MAVHPLVIAELKIRAAQQDLKQLELEMHYPGESVGTASRRHRNRRRSQEIADSYRRLVELAEGSGEWLRPLILCLISRKSVDFEGATVPSWAQEIVAEMLPGGPE